MHHRLFPIREGKRLVHAQRHRFSSTHRLEDDDGARLVATFDLRQQQASHDNRKRSAFHPSPYFDLLSVRSMEGVITYGVKFSTDFLDHGGKVRRRGCGGQLHSACRESALAPTGSYRGRCTRLKEPGRPANPADRSFFPSPSQASSRTPLCLRYLSVSASHQYRWNR